MKYKHSKRHSRQLLDGVCTLSCVKVNSVWLVDEKLQCLGTIAGWTLDPHTV